MQSKLKIFFKGSTTYFTSSLFFPESVRNDVFTLYAFVRLADNYIDQKDQNISDFNEFVKKYQQALSGRSVDETVINDFVQLQTRKKFKQVWIDAFLSAMKQDTKKHLYETINETKKYMYGSAEVIGLMMAAILELPKKSYPSAKMLGRAMQYANFIRDIEEDIILGRQYIPSDVIKKYQFTSLNKPMHKSKVLSFKKMIHQEIKRYEAWQAKAEKGFVYIPKRSLIAIKTASDMYRWTMNQIKKDPMIVYQKKVKPSRSTIILTALKNIITL